MNTAKLRTLIHKHLEWGYTTLKQVYNHWADNGPDGDIQNDTNRAAQREPIQVIVGSIFAGYPNSWRCDNAKIMLLFSKVLFGLWYFVGFGYRIVFKDINTIQMHGK